MKYRLKKDVFYRFLTKNFQLGLNGKVERSHLTDKQEFYQLLDYTNDVNLREKIKEWEDFYNFNRPHKSHGGLTPYEVFRAKMNIEIQSQP